MATCTTLQCSVDGVHIYRRRLKLAMRSCSFIMASECISGGCSFITASEEFECIPGGCHVLSGTGLEMGRKLSRSTLYSFPLSRRDVGPHSKSCHAIPFAMVSSISPGSGMPALRIRASGSGRLQRDQV